MRDPAGARSRAEIQLTLLQHPFIRPPQAFLQANFGFPAHGLQAADVHQLAGRAIGFVGIEYDLARVADNGLDQLGQLGDGFE